MFTEGESNYPKIEKMCCALVWVMQRLRQYTLYHTVRLLSKTDPLKYLLGSPSSMRNIAKWRCQLMEYDIEYVLRTSVKGQAIADHLVEFSIDDDTLINSNFPDEGILQVSDEKETPGWKMYFDGAVNSTRSGGDRPQNQGARSVWRFHAHNLSDAQAVEDEESQTGAVSRVPRRVDRELREYLVHIHTAHEEPICRALATLASMVSITKENLIEPLEFEIAKGLAHYDMIEAVDGEPWYANIKHLLQTGQFPAFTNRHDKRTLRRIAAHFFLSGETFYRHSFDATLLRCVDGNEAQCLMEEVHEGNCGPHMNGPMLVKKLMRLDYFWWIEATTLASVTAKAVVRFLKHDIIAHYGVPVTLITDNAKNLNNKLIDELCAQFRIQHRNSSPYRPQMNGAVEAANKNIKKIIGKMMVNYKDWHKMLSFVLLAYQRSIRSSTEATSYSLVYGMEAVLPVEVEIPSMWILAESKLKEVEWAKQCYKQLNLIDEKRLTAPCHGQCYQQRMA
ncbi:hypothetical protein CRG98_018767 [Punica granatum]|uniref:Integrase catalytic domain-containing protein n=1 Tax=Punica granatum TaxID=22663 RepID=A0A2I0JZF6_PUNGR|nr:hypothetical protein CRG98_018767 [Punica granatum]